MIYFNNSIISSSELDAKEMFYLQINSTFQKNNNKTFSKEFPILAISLNEVENNRKEYYMNTYLDLKKDL